MLTRESFLDTSSYKADNLHDFEWIAQKLHVASVILKLPSLYSGSTRI